MPGASFPLGGGTGSVCMANAPCCSSGEAMLSVSRSMFTVVGICLPAVKPLSNTPYGGGRTLCVATLWSVTQ